MVSHTNVTLSTSLGYRRQTPDNKLTIQIFFYQAPCIVPLIKYNFRRWRRRILRPGDRLLRIDTGPIAACFVPSQTTYEHRRSSWQAKGNRRHRQMPGPAGVETKCLFGARLTEPALDVL